MMRFFSEVEVEDQRDVKLCEEEFKDIEEDNFDKKKSCQKGFFTFFR